MHAQQPQQPGLLTGLFEAIQAGLQQQAQESQFKAASLEVKGLMCQPPGLAASREANFNFIHIFSMQTAYRHVSVLGLEVTFSGPERVPSISLCSMLALLLWE